MGVGWKLAPLWALALTLASAQHAGKAPEEQLSQPGPGSDLASLRLPHILGWLCGWGSGGQLRGLALAPGKLSVSVSGSRA